MVSRKLSILATAGLGCGTVTHGQGRSSGRCLAVYGEGDRDACPGREHECVPGLTKPTGSDGRLQRGDGSGGVGTLKVFRHVGDAVAWDTEPHAQGVKEAGRRGSGDEQIDVADIHSQTAQEASNCQYLWIEIF